MKVLYITFANSQKYSGGDQCSRRNLEALQLVAGTDNVTAYIIKPDDSQRGVKEKLDRMWGVAKGYFGGLTQNHLTHILSLIANGQFTDLFIDNSQLGLVAKYAKRQKPSLRTTTFFHNIELDFVKSNVYGCHDYKHFFWISLARTNETAACQYADNIIVLNDKDRARLKECYGRQAEMTIPITLKDSATGSATNSRALSSDGKFNLLFVGSYFFGNTKGLKWFCEDVLPHVDAHLTIVGSGMDAFANDIAVTEQITIHSNVPHLAEYYEQADIMVLPITTGGGMKVKTAEALMYGKYIVGTPQSLEGYHINDDIAKVCTTAEDFIKAINCCRERPKYNPPSRQLFETKYSFNTAVEAFRKLLNTTRTP